VPPAEHLVAHLVRLGFGVADHDLLTLARDRAVEYPGVEAAGPPAPAEHFDLQPEHLVRELKKPLRGREKLHYLNPVPLHEIYERWIAKYERPRLQGLSALKKHLEANEQEPHHGEA